MSQTTHQGIPRQSVLLGEGPRPRATARLIRAAQAAESAVTRAIGGPLGLSLAYTLLAILFTWPLALRLDDSVVALGDPIDSIWRLGWGQRQLLREPWNLFDGHVFYPYPRSYLFDELLIGIAIVSLPFRLLTGNPVAIYNLAVLASFVFSALAMYALARRLGAGRAGAFASGLIYAFAPLHMGHLTHLGLLSGQYFPLAIVLLDRLFDPAARDTRRRDALLLGATLALQALSAQYYAFYLVFVVGGFVGSRLVRERPRGHWPARSTWAGLAVAGGLAGLAVLPFALSYRAVQLDYTVKRSIAQSAYYSANLASFFTADGQNWLWGRVTAPLREYGRYTLERNLFPGLLALVLALAGALTAWRRPLAQYLILLGGGSAILALGPNLYLTADNKSLIFTHLPYGFLYYHLPGFDSMRVPARFGILYGLSIAGLAGLGLTWLLARATRWRPHAPRSQRRALTTALALLVIVGIGVESLNRPFSPVQIPTGEQVPPVYRWLAAQPDAVLLELPFVIPDHPDRFGMLGDFYQYYALYHGRPVVNGSANVTPKGYTALHHELKHGPTPRALAILQGLGVTHLTVHYDQLDAPRAARTHAVLEASGSPTSVAATFGPTVVYRLAPADHFARLRALIPRQATIYLSKEDRLGTYGGMLRRVLRENRIYTRARVEFGQDYAGLPEAGARYDYAILYHQEDPAAAGFPSATLVWEDDVVRVYRLGGSWPDNGRPRDAR